jgi:putative SOS response-associated peptidase YedK
LLPVIVWDPEARARRVAKMRWGFPDPRDWRRPRPIHARSETIDAKEPFRTPFHAVQRGIVVFRTFNEGEEVVKPSGRTETRQWTVDPQAGQTRGFAFVWRRFEIPDLPVPMLACVRRRCQQTSSYAARSSPRRMIPACRLSWTTTPGLRGWAKTARRRRRRRLC